MNKRTACTIILTAMTIGMAPPAHGAENFGECIAGKLKAAGKAASCLMKSQAKDALGKPSNAARCSDKLRASFERAEGKGSCITHVDNATVAARVDDSMKYIAQYLRGIRFVDNFDGTVTDTSTGLMWEQKTQGPTCTTGSGRWDLHCVYSTYRWSTAGGAFDSIWQWLAAINGFPGESGLGGYQDWRIPSAAELQSLLFDASCSQVPCIDATFDPTLAAAYWSATGVPDDPSPGIVVTAQVVSFDDGTVSSLHMGLTAAVRAVRGVPR